MVEVCDNQHKGRQCGVLTPQALMICLFTTTSWNHAGSPQVFPMIFTIHDVHVQEVVFTDASAGALSDPALLLAIVLSVVISGGRHKTEIFCCTCGIYSDLSCRPHHLWR
jgi:hypothetical protein